jgi:hypothetical protein
MSTNGQNNRRIENEDVNVLVMSDSGKPIFVRYDEGEQTTRVCGILQALRASSLNSCNLGDLRALRSGSLQLVFMTAGLITLVAICKVDCKTRNATATEVYLKVRLEYVYSQILLSLTDQIQNMLQQNASYDLSVLVSSEEAAINSILNDSGLDGDPAVFLTGGVSSIFPISPTARYLASVTLRRVGSLCDNIVFALIVVNDSLLTIIQPAFRPHQMRGSDLQIFLRFLNRQPSLYVSELWFPICFPRFNSCGFLHCYTQCLHPETKTIIAIVSQDKSTDQFQSIRSACVIVRRDLGIREELIDASETSCTDGNLPTDKNAVKQRLGVQLTVSGCLDTPDSDEDYVDASGDGENMIPYGSGRDSVCFLSAIRVATDSAAAFSRIMEYLQVSNAYHFLFRFDAPIEQDDMRSSGHLTQCIRSDFACPSKIDLYKVWSSYLRLSLRLRMGSASLESVSDALDMISDDAAPSDILTSSENGCFCPAIAFAEAPPNLQGLSYITSGKITMLGMNGQGFELCV